MSAPSRQYVGVAAGLVGPELHRDCVGRDRRRTVVLQIRGVGDLFVQRRPAVLHLVAAAPVLRRALDERDLDVAAGRGDAAAAVGGVVVRRDRLVGVAEQAVGGDVGDHRRHAVGDVAGRQQRQVARVSQRRLVELDRLGRAGGDDRDAVSAATEKVARRDLARHRVAAGAEVRPRARVPGRTRACRRCAAARSRPCREGHGRRRRCRAALR